MYSLSSIVTHLQLRPLVGCCFELMAVLLVLLIITAGGGLRFFTHGSTGSGRSYRDDD